MYLIGTLRCDCDPEPEVPIIQVFENGQVAILLDGKINMVCRYDLHDVYYTTDHPAAFVPNYCV